MNQLMRHCLYGTSKNANDCDMSVTVGIEMAKFSDGPEFHFPQYLPDLSGLLSRLARLHGETIEAFCLLRT
jgi:hypothetical protein